ncbi:sigma-54-dependent transcriptional regulator [Candidatus Magnetaquicoccus inordinatus]|uniref:sigma-54-dependent transcriptional regulator n=1 Tax=Candidatus Magnetaquicoccus inordinatus TaxID=2496818 RepID=UPI00102B340C|nr:sigma-54 dependent transcriptional regulator [Candidatus Magnetaquicoccus inordinatus]
MNHTILIVDDEESIRTSLRGILEDEQYAVLEAPSGEAALELLSTHPVSAVLLDIWMDGIDGVETLRRFKQQEIGKELNADVPVIMMSGHGTIETAVTATKEGAYDFLEKPLSLDRILLLLGRAIREWLLLRENRALRARIENAPAMIGTAPVMQALEQQIRRMAPTDGWVLLIGENGTGKEVAARRVHELSKRANAPFIAVNSAAIPEKAIETELFGREKSGPDGTTIVQPGRFEQSNHGTLFLDAVGDMPLKMQAKILRALQEQQIERVGGQQPIRVDVRVIAATNKNLEEEIAEGRFRQDLYYRLNVIPLHIPPLRERLEDIPLLVEHFIAMQQANMVQTRHFSAEALATMQNYHWPGNVRELKNLVERLLIMASGERIEPSDLPDFLYKRELPDVGQPWQELLEHNLRDAREMFERVYLQAQLDRQQGNISRTAEVIGMERSALHRKLKILGLG